MHGSRKFHQGGPDNIFFLIHHKGPLWTDLEKQSDPYGSDCFWRGVHTRIFKKTYIMIFLGVCTPCPSSGSAHPYGKLLIGNIVHLIFIKKNVSLKQPKMMLFSYFDKHICCDAGSFFLWCSSEACTT